MSQYSSSDSNHGEGLPYILQSWESSGVVPPEHPFRTLVLCFDGTGDQFDEDNSNVLQFFSMLKKNNPEAQMVYYQTGFGTFTLPYIITPIASAITKALDMAFAWNLSNHVMGGYEFLMQNYRAGDRICIFGFSRGAYTARSLAGMLHKVGLLPQCNHRQVPLAYKLYSKEGSDNDKRAKNFKQAFSIDVDIEFVGVWDTVSSVGLIPRHLPFTSSNCAINTFRHAVSLDEHRVKFLANLWHEDEQHKHGNEQPNHEEYCTDLATRGFFTNNQAKQLTKFQLKYVKWREDETDKQEVWFAGAHCDVGGGSVMNGTRYSLARIPLRWMIRECFKRNSGIMFSNEGLQVLGMDPASLYDINTGVYPKNSEGQSLPRLASLQVTAGDCIRTAKNDKDNFHTLQHIPLKSEEEEELHDALSPAYDVLSPAHDPRPTIGQWLRTGLWSILEYIPLYVGPKKSEIKLQVNMARPRRVPKPNSTKPEDKVKIHRSVRMRMNVQSGGKRSYTPMSSLEWDNFDWDNYKINRSQIEWVD